MVVGPLVPGDNRDPKLIIGLPGTALETSLLDRVKSDCMAALSPLGLIQSMDPAVRWKTRANRSFRPRNRRLRPDSGRIRRGD